MLNTDLTTLMLVATADFVMFYTGSETPPVVMSGYMDALARTQRRACAQHTHSQQSAYTQLYGINSGAVWGVLRGHSPLRGHQKGAFGPLKGQGWPFGPGVFIKNILNFKR